MARRKVRVDRPDSCRFDKQAADRAVSFFETHLKHTTGIYAGKPFKLADWQRHDIREIFGRQVWDPEFKLWRRQVRQVYIEVPKKNGKALAVDTVIPTPSGWSQMSDLAVGDQVFDDRGRPCSVVAVSPVMHGRPCYRLTFSDGTSIVADEEHQWKTWTRQAENPSVVTTRQIAETQAEEHQVPGIWFRQIVKVELVESVPVRCIQVDSPSRLFLAGESMVATHNSELAAGVALKLLFADDEYGAEVYGAASDREQASIVFNVAASMVRKDPALLKACGGGKNISDSRKRIVCPRWESFYHAVSAEVAGKHGYKAHGVIFDEVHAQKDRRLWEVMTFGSGDSRVQPLTFAITTAGVRGESPVAEELHEDADQILRGVVPCPDDFYPVIYGAPDDAPWDSEEVWRACNPALGDFLMLGKLREACEQAKRRPSEENSFRRLRLNQWTSQDVRVMSLDDWDACAQSFDWRDLRDRPCYVGVDLSSKLDLTSVVLVWVDDNGGIYLMPYFWVPREAVNGSRAQLDPVRFQAWEKAGAINLVDGGEIDYGEIREQFRIFRDEMRINIHQVAYDPMFARQLSQELAKDGFEVVEFRQQYTDFTPPFLALQDAVPQGKVRHNGHPVLRWNVDCLSARQTTDGRIKPSKPDRLRSRKRIDGVVATLMGLGRAIVNYGYQGEASVYDSAEAVM